MPCPVISVMDVTELRVGRPSFAGAPAIIRFASRTQIARVEREGGRDGWRGKTRPIFLSIKR